MSKYDNSNSAALFQNDKKGNEKAPDYKGKGQVYGKDVELAAWVRKSEKGTNYLSISFSEPFKKDGGQTFTKSAEKPAYKQSKPDEDGLPF
jgi:uncharacterized protein (DUF736 family)